MLGDPDIRLRPAVGWRSWRVVNGRLASPTYDALWPIDDWLEAVDHHGNKIETPVDHHMGIHAFHDRERVQPHMVIGEVELSGWVTQYQYGWRAQRARPKRLFVHWGTPGKEDLARALAVYGVPVEIMDAPAHDESSGRKRLLRRLLG